MIKAIETRRSQRSYTGKPISKVSILEIIKAGTKAPSGKNGQPWRFVVIHEDKKLIGAVSDLSIYRSFMCQADCLIAVYLDESVSYNHLKDAQAIGACIQNMLLQAEELGIGSCWIGEILSNAEAVNRLLIGGNKNLELMAVIIFGYADKKPSAPPTKAFEECIIQCN